jgi:hypothetical protein
MDLIIENVEQLTLTLPVSTDAAPLYSLLAGWAIKTPPSSAAPAAAPKFNTKSWSTPRLGQVWSEQGGIHVGYMRGAPGLPDYYLVAASDTAGETTEIAWSTESSDTEATSKCDGLANTRILAASALDFPAAKWASGLRLGEFSDWYLPSQRELALASANTPEAFASAWYWSSTQYSRHTAWCQYFDAGRQDDGNKSAKLRARAFRRFIP